ELGLRSSWYVTLCEQLAIFLYTCVMGLSVGHVGECFQWSNNTISKYFTLILLLVMDAVHFCSVQFMN
ncbi:hypothetical protein K439DRAFT_1344279, partial [Ramaria rubella]